MKLVTTPMIVISSITKKIVEIKDYRGRAGKQRTKSLMPM